MPDRGRWTGNRGCLHDAAKRISGRRWTTRAWICCRLDYEGRRREIMSPRRWTELFFLDEATALSAGHRPCFFCRNASARHFKALWAEAADRDVGAPEIDRQLHRERLRPERARRPAHSLPTGVLVLFRDSPHLVMRDALLPWSFGGYGEPAPMPARRAGDLELLTPPSLATVLAMGYKPDIAASAPARCDLDDPGGHRAPRQPV